jgi:hypothetical protein
MRFTRRIPGIRLPVPGRLDWDDSDPVPPGSAPSLVFVFVLAILGIYLFCTLKFGGGPALFWLEPRVAGLSPFVLASLINGLLALLVLGGFLIARAGRRREWKNLVSTIAVLVLLGSTQVLLNGWKHLATTDRERTLARTAREAESLAELRADLESLSDHAWAGEYRGLREGGEVRLLVRPNDVGRMLLLDQAHLIDGSLPHRLGSLGQGLKVQVGWDRLVVQRPGRFDSWKTLETYAVVEWGARRYLVAEGELALFLARTVETAPADDDLSRQLLSRVNDRDLPFEGSPKLVKALPSER